MIIYVMDTSSLIKMKEQYPRALFRVYGENWKIYAKVGD